MDNLGFGIINSFEFRGSFTDIRNYYYLISNLESGIFYGKLILFKFLCDFYHQEKQINLKSIQKRLGYLYFKIIFAEFERPMRSIGSNIQNFYNNLNFLHETLINHEEIGPRFLNLHEKFTGYSPSFRCEIEKLSKSDSPKAINLNIFTTQEQTSGFINNFYFGLIQGSAKFLFNLNVKVEKIRIFDQIIKYDKSLEKYLKLKKDLKISPYIMSYRVQALNESAFDSIIGDGFSDDPNDLLLSADLFKSTYPFTIIIDRNLTIQQIGDGLIRHLGQLMQSGHGAKFLTYFSIVTPILKNITFDSLLKNQNLNYKLKIKSIEGQHSTQFEDMELRGSFLYIKESDCLLFIGSPIINKFEEMISRSLYIADIPIHDSTRDIILVGEQTKAQVFLNC